MNEKTKALSRIKVLGPWQKTEHHLLWPSEKVVLRGFFGLPPGVVVERVKIGNFVFEEMGAFGKTVFPGQPCVVIFENKSNEPKSLANALLSYEAQDVSPKGVLLPNPSSPEPEETEGTTLLSYSLRFGGGRARVGFRTREMCTLEDVWACAASLEEAHVMHTRFSGASLHAWKGMVLPEGTPVELWFSPCKGSSSARAVVRLRKSVFPAL